MKDKFEINEDLQFKPDPNKPVKDWWRKLLILLTLKNK